MGRGDDRGAQMLRNIMTTEADYSLLENVGASEEAIDFISRLLNRDPKARPKEPECFQHPWIAEVPDEFEYEEVGEPIQTGPLTELIAVPELSEEEEQDEKDAWARRAWSLERELEDKREAYCKQPDGEAEQRLSSSDQNANAKKPRVTLEQDIEEKHVQHQDDVRYPSLPQLSSYQYEAKAEVKSSPNGPRLFGEITPSLIKSSGVLGEDYSEEMDIAEFDEDGADDSSDQYVISNEGSSLSKDIFAEVGQPHPPLTMRPPPPPKASDPSLMGAESLVGHLHMRSAGQNGMASGDRSDGDGDIGKPLDGDSQNSRKYASSNGTAKGNWAELKPGPFSSRNRHSPSGDNLTSYRSVPRDMSSSVETNKPHSAAPSERMGNQDEIPNELACTIDERTGLEVPSQSQPNQDINVHNEETKEKGNGFVKPATILGKLTPLPGSILDQPIRLESRMTSWGRGTQATIRHPDSMDFRIPSYALELTFWAPSIEARIAAGEDWLQMTDVVTLISTKTSQCIWVNDVELRKESRSKDAFLFGRIYTGDIITVYRSKDQFLRFRCEFYHGKSRLERPADEKRFLIEESPKSYCNARTDGNPAAKSERPPVEASA